MDNECKFDKGKVVEEWQTGDSECDAFSQRYECGGIYNHNYMDIVGSRDHDCFWDCTDCRYKKKPDPEEPTLKYHTSEMTDKNIFKIIFNKAGVKYTEEGDKLCIDLSEVNGGHKEICIQFIEDYDIEDLNGKFSAVIVYDM